MLPPLESDRKPIHSQVKQKQFQNQNLVVVVFQTRQKNRNAIVPVLSRDQVNLNSPERQKLLTASPYV